MEHWKEIFDGDYAVSMTGKIMRLTYSRGTYPGKLLKPIMNPDGYHTVSLRGGDGQKRSYRVHRLVAAAFLESSPERPQINHKNGIRTDNRVENLEWCTNLENALHASRQGWLKHGSKHKSTHLTELNVQEIRSQYARGEKMQALARVYGLTLGTLHPLIRGKTWKHVPGAQRENKAAPAAKLTAEDVRMIRAQLQQGIARKSICQEFSISPGTVSEIATNKIWMSVQ